MAKPKTIRLERESGPFNDLIAARMKELQVVSLNDFAERAGIKRTTLYNLVQRRVSRDGTVVKPSVDTLFILARALDISPAILLFRLEPPTSQVEQRVGS